MTDVLRVPSTQTGTVVFYPTESVRSCVTQQLIVPMDDSALARAALEHALTAFGDVEVTVVHVVDDLEIAYGGGAPGVEEGEPTFFEDVRDLAIEHDVAVETAVLEGAPADAIVEYVADEPADGIVMGSEGRSGVSRVLLGSVAEAVARRSPVPVTIVPAPDRNTGENSSAS